MIFFPDTPALLERHGLYPIELAFLTRAHSPEPTYEQVQEFFESRGIIASITVGRAIGSPGAVAGNVTAFDKHDAIALATSSGSIKPGQDAQEFFAGAARALGCLVLVDGQILVHPDGTTEDYVPDDDVPRTGNSITLYRSANPGPAIACLIDMPEPGRVGRVGDYVAMVPAPEFSITPLALAGSYRDYPLFSFENLGQVRALHVGLTEADYEVSLFHGPSHTPLRSGPQGSAAHMVATGMAQISQLQLQESKTGFLASLSRSRNQAPKIPIPRFLTTPQQGSPTPTNGSASGVSSGVPTDSGPRKPRLTRRRHNEAMTRQVAGLLDEVPNLIGGPREEFFVQAVRALGLGPDVEQLVRAFEKESFPPVTEPLPTSAQPATAHPVQPATALPVTTQPVKLAGYKFLTLDALETGFLGNMAVTHATSSLFAAASGQGWWNKVFSKLRGSFPVRTGFLAFCAAVLVASITLLAAPGLRPAFLESGDVVFALALAAILTSLGALWVAGYGRAKVLLGQAQENNLFGSEHNPGPLTWR